MLLLLFLFLFLLPGAVFEPFPFEFAQRLANCVRSRPQHRKRKRKCCHCHVGWHRRCIFGPCSGYCFCQSSSIIFRSGFPLVKCCRALSDSHSPVSSKVVRERGGKKKFAFCTKVSDRWFVCNGLAVCVIISFVSLDLPANTSLTA